MKKFFEQNPLVHYTIVLTIVAIACGLVIGGINAWTAPIIEENAYKAKVAAYQSVLPDMDEFTELDTSSDPDSIQEKVEAKDSDGIVIGYIININQTNGYGNMQIVMAIGADGTILSADFLQLNQTLNLPNTRENLQMYVGQNINAQHNYDFLSGATRSLETLTAMMLDVNEAFGNIDIEPTVDIEAERLERYQGLLSDTASFTELDVSTDPDSIVIKAELKDASDAVIGYAIEAFDHNNFGDLQIVIVTDTDGLIVGAEFVTYANSYFETQMNAVLDDLVGDNIANDLTDYLLTAPSSTDTVPSMEALLSDVTAAFDHIDTEGAGA